jgi:hypothetical protein
MHHHFNDITSRIVEVPTWYDQNGTPRYGKFTPDDVPNIYATEALLMNIKCQDCGTPFMVALSFCMMDKLYNPRAYSYEEDIKTFMKDRDHRWFPAHYGDPPSHGCVGDTMNCIDVAIVEFWKKDKFVWVRKPEYEIKGEDA